MRSIIKLLFTGIVLTQSIFFSGELTASQNDAVNRQRMLGDLDFIKNTFEVNYAHIAWKKEFSGWDLATEIDLAKNKIAQADSVKTKDFQIILKDFFNSAKDYHVCINFHSTESAILPFLVQSSEGRYFFSYIDSWAEKFPFSTGDELIALDDVPIHQYVTDLKLREVGENFSGTDQALAEYYLTTRSGSLGHVIPKGPIVIAGRKKNSTKVITHRLNWDYSEEKIKDVLNAPPVRKAPKKKSFAALQKKTPLGSHKFFQKSVVMPQYSALASLRMDEGGPTTLLGSYKSFVPELGTVRWKNEEDKAFLAYLFDLPNKKVGAYVRIARYKGDVERNSEEFAKLIDFFEKRSDVLVIDQVNNPGGLVLYLYSLISMLSDKPLVPPKHRQMITQEDVAFALDGIPSLEKIKTDEEAIEEIGKTLEGIPVTYDVAHCLLNYCRFVVGEWNSGRLFTNPVFLYGMGPITPHPTSRYTKPILVLVNSMDFSGGDFFPAILQDAKRATIFGMRTAGAGGYLATGTFANLNGIADFQYTASIAERPTGILLENNGVTPDVIYEPSVNDLQNNYVDYVQKVLETLQSMM